MTDQSNPLSVFAAQPKETEGVTIDIEHPTSGETLMRWTLARFGGANNPKIVREDRKLKAKMTQGQRRAIEAGSGDPDVVHRFNRQLFVRVSVLGYEMVDPRLKELYPDAYSPEKADQLLTDFPRLYDELTAKASDEEVYAADALADAQGN